jgi:hypothetical protein
VSAPKRKARPSTPRRRPAKKAARPPRTVPAAGPSAVPDDPWAAPPTKYYRCPKGHEQQDTEEFSLRLGNAFTGQVMHDTGPLCYRCVFDYVNPVGSSARQYDEGGENWYGAVFAFLSESFQTRRIPPPDITPGEMAAVVQAAETDDADRSAGS